jgi:hypothetical protein
MRSLGLLQRRQLLVPTLRGWILLSATATGLMIAGVLGVVPFLETHRPLHSGILIVEGWLPDYAMVESKETFESHSYRMLVVTGVPLAQGHHLAQEKNYAQLGARTLLQLGLPESSVAIVACPEVPRDRTYATALEAGSWLDQNARGEPVDVFTHGVHARRTWLLYRLALHPRHKVGVIAGNDLRYDKRRWWNSSAGFRVVTGELVAFLYAKFLFYPQPYESKSSAHGTAKPTPSNTSRNMISAITRKIPNRTRATTAAPAATPVKPSPPATNAMIRNMIAHVSMFPSSICVCCSQFGCGKR